MIQRFEIPGRLAGLNEIIAAARLSKFASSAQKREETNRCAWSARAAAPALVPVELPAVFRFVWIEPNEARDPDNIAAGAKFILDGLVRDPDFAGRRSPVCPDARAYFPGPVPAAAARRGHNLYSGPGAGRSTGPRPMKSQS